jgi:hypothetical protein
VASGKAGAKKEARKLKARKAPDGFKPDVAAGLNRNATTSACVGWDKHNIESRPAFRKQRERLRALQACRQNGFTITRITMPIINAVGTSLIIR